MAGAPEWLSPAKFASSFEMLKRSAQDFSIASAAFGTVIPSCTHISSQNSQSSLELLCDSRLSCSSFRLSSISSLISFMYFFDSLDNLSSSPIPISSCTHAFSHLSKAAFCLARLFSSVLSLSRCLSRFSRSSLRRLLDSQCDLSQQYVNMISSQVFPELGHSPALSRISEKRLHGCIW